MVRLWARAFKNHKTINQYDYTNDEKIDWSHFYEYVRDTCEAMDYPTPVVLKTHIFNFAKYNSVKFNKSDFVESVPFDYLLIENVF